MTYGHKMGTADTSGGRGRRFKSSHPDQYNQVLTEIHVSYFSTAPVWLMVNTPFFEWSVKLR